MKNSYLALVCGVILFIVLSMAWCKPQPDSQTALASPVPSTTATATAAPVAVASPIPAGTSAAASASPVASPTATPSSELRKAADKVAPAVVLLSVFDASGKLLRTGTGFFISDDGKFVAPRFLVDGGVNAIASTADKKIHNVVGVLAESPELDIAVLKAETKQVASLALNAINIPDSGARVAIVGTPLARREGAIAEAKVAARRSTENAQWLDLDGQMVNETIGSPVVNENGVIVGMVAADREKNPPVASVLSAHSLQAFLAKLGPDAAPKWAAAPPTPTPSPKMRKGKIVFAPAPTFPSSARGANVVKGTGSYRILFDVTGKAKNVQVLKSSGAPALDQAAVTALAQWKSDAGPEWTVVVPVSFAPRGAN